MKKLSIFELHIEKHYAYKKTCILNLLRYLHLRIVFDTLLLQLLLSVLPDTMQNQMSLFSIYHYNTINFQIQPTHKPNIITRKALFTDRYILLDIIEILQDQHFIKIEHKTSTNKQGAIHNGRPTKTRISRPPFPLRPDKTIESHSNNN